MNSAEKEGPVGATPPSQANGSVKEKQWHITMDDAASKGDFAGSTLTKPPKRQRPNLRVVEPDGEAPPRQPAYGESQRIVANGYLPIPISLPDDKDKAAGKRPPVGYKDWTDWTPERYKSCLTGFSKITYQHCGVGLLCSVTPACDIDVLDQDLAAKIEALAVEMLGATPLRRVGRAPKRLLVYRFAGDPFPKLKTAVFRLPTEPPISKDFKGHAVEVLADGQQFVAYGTHPGTRKPYCWTGAGTPENTPVDALPAIAQEQVEAFLAAAERTFADAGYVRGSGPKGGTRGGRANSRNDEADLGVIASAVAAIPNDDCQYDYWVRIGMAIKGAVGDAGAELFAEWSAKSAKNDPATTDKAYLSFAPREIGAGSIYHIAQEHGWKFRPHNRSGGDWYSRCITNQDGSVVSCFANSIRALREDPAWQGVFGFDGMERATLLLKPIHRHDGSQAVEGPFPRPVTDDDVSAVQEWLQIAGLPRLSKDTVHQTVDMRSKECVFHPVQDYLNSLKWDGENRIDGCAEPWLAKYFGCENTPYAAGIGRMFLVAMVARIFKPGCKADYMVILDGDQGFRKSTACEILASPQWFSDSLPENITSKDTSQHLRGKWLIEIGELHAMSKAESTALKAFLTRTTERYRPSYGRKDVHEPRQCLFIGTTNKSVYLRDETGGRRFWPVKVGVTRTLADTDALIRDRDQLFAEAVQRFKAGEKWWPDSAFEAVHIKPQQERVFEVDPWEDDISVFLADKTKVKVTEVGMLALGCGAVERIGTNHQRRIAAVMERLGWVRDPVKRHGGVHWWVPGGSLAGTE
ncbi:MAG: VapE domain-containing protein [Candidatus Methylumidiphilus sp.]